MSYGQHMKLNLCFIQKIHYSYSSKCLNTRNFGFCCCNFPAIYTLSSNAGINLTGYHPLANPLATNLIFLSYSSKCLNTWNFGFCCCNFFKYTLLNRSKNVHNPLFKNNRSNPLANQFTLNFARMCPRA